MKRLEQLVARCDAAIAREDLDAAFALNTDFHTALIELSGNRHLEGLLDTLRRLVLFIAPRCYRIPKGDTRNKALYLDRLRVKQDCHREILAALRANDGALAATLMQKHVRETAEDLLPALPDTVRADDDRSAA